VHVVPEFHPIPYTQLEQDHLLIPGTPILLLPLGIPAYFLEHYIGPVTSLELEFSLSLQGLGAGEWNSKVDQHDEAKTLTPYIITWMGTHNEKGTEHGLKVIWPRRLALLASCSPSRILQSPHASSPLNSIATNDGDRSGQVTRLQDITRAINLDIRSASLEMSVTRVTNHSTNDINEAAMGAGEYIGAAAQCREEEQVRARKERDECIIGLLKTEELGVHPDLCDPESTKASTTYSSSMPPSPETSMMPN
jgi:mediator of RNA polymerase II transcription subunit 13